MKELLKKIAICKDEIKSKSIKKEGQNTFSKYDYFTPSQVEALVFEVCQKHQILTTFELVRDQFGITGILSVVDIESGQQKDYRMATDIPEIKATNIAQQLGGCMTYTERYLKQSAFGIIDNSLDFDTTENTKKAQEQKSEIPIIWLTEDQFKSAMASDAKGITATINAYSGNGKSMKKEYREQLTAKLKTL